MITWGINKFLQNERTSQSYDLNNCIMAITKESLV
jgi:hypothetical protein